MHVGIDVTCIHANFGGRLEILLLLLFCETNNLLGLLYLFLFLLLGRFFFSTPFTPGGKAQGGGST